MKAGIPKISVLIVTYNQENEIGRALDSLIAQKDYIYEIIVNDDCSTDKNWEVINSYAAKYPDLVKPRQNEKNLGIFENYERTWKMPSGDIVHQLEGDDACGENYFEKVIEFIEENNIDYENELFCIYGDYLVKYPNGDSLTRKNDLVTKGINLIKLSNRVLISNRSTCYSKKIMDKFIDVSQGRSHIAEKAQEIQLQVLAEKNYYNPAIGNVYFSNIGVSTRINEARFLERQKLMPYTREILRNKFGIELDKKDNAYIDYYNSFFRSRHYPSLKNYLRRYYHFLRSIDPAIGFRGLDFKHVVFAVLRRLPHKKPINW